MNTQPPIYFQKEMLVPTAAPPTTEVKGWFGWDLPPFCPAFSSEFVFNKLLRDTGNRRRMCAGVPRTVGSARRREEGLGWKGEQSPSPLK